MQQAVICFVKGEIGNIRVTLATVYAPNEKQGDLSKQDSGDPHGIYRREFDHRGRPEHSLRYKRRHILRDIIYFP